MHLDCATTSDTAKIDLENAKQGFPDVALAQSTLGTTKTDLENARQGPAGSRPWHWIQRQEKSKALGGEMKLEGDLAETFELRAWEGGLAYLCVDS